MRNVIGMLMLLCASVSSVSAEEPEYDGARITTTVLQPECSAEFTLATEKKGIRVTVFLPIEVAKPTAEVVRYRLGAVIPREEAVNPFDPALPRTGRIGPTARLCEFKHQGRVVRSGILFRVNAMRETAIDGNEYFVAGIYLPKAGTELETVIGGTAYVGKWHFDYEFPDRSKGVVAILVRK
jgi:hypothetical protein